MKKITQEFGIAYNYALHFTTDVFSRENTLFRDLIRDSGRKGPTRVLFVLDKGVALSHPDLQDRIAQYCKAFDGELRYTETLLVPGGEAAKNDPALVELVLKAIDEHHICRHSFVVAIGGGAVIDMTGYATTIAHRGVRHIRIPTTVLAQDDAAVGVKNGVNRFGKKNFIGAFSVPYAIINDYDFLHTLEQRDWISGVAEAVKVALIKDAEFFEFLEANAAAIANRDQDVMQHVIHRCAEIHMQHIAQGGDPFESGSSRPLDFGHWAAHKLEHLTGYELRHGEAVAKGIALDVVYSYQCGHIDKEVMNRVLQLMKSIGFDLTIPVEVYGKERILKGLEEFREHLGGELTITLIKGVGKKYDVNTIDRDRMLESMNLLNSYCE